MIMDIQGAVVERRRGAGRVAGLDQTSPRPRTGHRCSGDLCAGGLPVRCPRGAPTQSNVSRFSGSAGFEEEDAATQIHPAVAPLATEIVVTKRRVSAFAGSDLDMVLRSSEVDELVLCGISTSGVVLSTLRQAADLDYQLVVLQDGCADLDPEVHRVLLEKVFPRQADVVTVDDWVLRDTKVS